MIFTGRIYDIIEINNDIAQIVVRKKNGDKIVPVAVNIYGFWKNKALNVLKIRAKDKIRGILYIQSKLNDKRQYYTNIYFREIFITEKSTNMSDLFHREDKDIDVDFNTGEVLS